MKKRVRIIMLVMTAFVIFGCIMTASSATVAPRWVIKNMMRADDTPGLRFSAVIYGDQRDDEKLEEYGFIIAAWDELQEKDVSVSAFTHNSPVSYLCSVNYSKSDGEIKIDKVFDISDGGRVTYACVIANIPEQHYESGIVAKPYIKYDGEIIYGVSFRVNYLAAAQNMLKSEEFEALSDEEKARVESVANYGKEEENEFELEKNPDAEGKDSNAVLDEIMSSSLSVAQNIVIPTSLKDVETVYISDIEENVTFVYAYVDGSVKYVPVYLEDCYPAIVEDGKLNAEYDEKLCIYTVDSNGLYHIRSLGYAENENGEYIGLEKEDMSVLYDEENENAMFYVDGQENQELFRVVGNRYDIGFDTRVVFDENTNIVIRRYDRDKDEYEYIIYDCDTIYDLEFNNIDLTYIVSNNPEKNSLERCYFLYGMTEENGIVNTPSAEPEEPVVPEEPETVEECNYRIIKSSDPCIDEDDYYRNCYTVLNLMTGKTETVYGNLTSETSSGIENTAVQIGSVVILKDGFVDDISGTVIDTFNAVQSPIHEIEGGKHKAGLVWILGYDEDTKTLSTSNVADGANWYDIGETVTFRFDSNIAVTMLKNAKANDLVQWGSFSLLTVDDLASSKNDYRCYNTRVLDDNNNLKTGYAKYIKAYIVTENRQDLEEGELNKVLSATVIVNGSENKAHLVTNKKPSAETE